MILTLALATIAVLCAALHAPASRAIAAAGIAGFFAAAFIAGAVQIAGGARDWLRARLWRRHGDAPLSIASRFRE